MKMKCKMGRNNKIKLSFQVYDDDEIVKNHHRRRDEDNCKISIDEGNKSNSSISKKEIAFFL